MPRQNNRTRSRTQCNTDLPIFAIVFIRKPLLLMEHVKLRSFEWLLGRSGSEGVLQNLLPSRHIPPHQDGFL
jgi:hypothetical protein